MKHWLFLALAIIAEVVVGYGLAFFFMSQTIKVIPVGITYAVWSGFGIVLVSFAS